MKSRRTLTARVFVGMLSAALLAGPLFLSSGTDSAASALTPQPSPAAAVGSLRGPISVSRVTIRIFKSGATYVDVATSHPATFSVLRLDNPRRLAVDLEGAHRTTRRRVYKAESPLLKGVRVGQFRSENPAIVRVVADLSGDPAADVRSTASGIRIELNRRDRIQSAEPPFTVQPAPQTPVPAAQAPPMQAPPPSVQAPPSSLGLVLPVQFVPNPSNPGTPPSSTAFYTRSPFASLSQNQKLLDALALRIVLSLGYRKGEPDEAAWKTTGAFGVAASRLLIKSSGPTSYRTIELSLVSSAPGGFELVVYGQQVMQATQGPNPDLAQVQQIVNEETARMQQMPPQATPATDLSQLAYQTYYLSYVTADRALGLLKTLGFTTVEYNEQAGESVYEKIYNPMKLGTGRPPVVVKLIDASKTSLMEPAPSSQPGMPVMMPGGQGQPNVYQSFAGGSSSSVPAIGGTFLDRMTSGEPLQRLLILYDKDDPDALQSLINLLQGTVDVPSREIMIEALVIEVNSNRTRDLGVNFETVQNNAVVGSAGVDSRTGAALSVFAFTKGAPRLATFNAQLQALLQKKEAQILSNPSVLVLDDRQARIQIGQQIPVTQQLTSAAGTISSVSYFPVGIVLNLRPRISEDGTQITMQTETIVSSINQAASNLVVGTQTLVAPVVDNRQVQSFVRVANDTPFIIGGLISTNDQKQMSGIPWLSEIPLLGALFRNSSTVTKIKQEVIIVITPHVLPPEDKYFSYVIPKDSDQFDRFNFRLFRNAYRIRGNDLFDLEFIYDSNVYKELVKRVTAASRVDPKLRTAEPFASVLKGGAPGEDVLVRRMLWEIIDHTRYARYINPDRIIYYENDPTAVGGAGFKLAFVSQRMKSLKDGQNALALKFEAHPQGTEERPFVLPKALVGFPDLTNQKFPQLLVDGNDRNSDGTPRDWMVLLTRDYSKDNMRDYGIRVAPLELLQAVLVLKRILELNRDMPLTLKDFHIGRQIIFPSQEDLQQGHHLVDREVARLFYEVYNYYPVFEQEFNREARYMNAKLDRTEQK